MLPLLTAISMRCKRLVTFIVATTPVNDKLVDEVKQSVIASQIPNRFSCSISCSAYAFHNHLPIIVHFSCKQLEFVPFASGSSIWGSSTVSTRGLDYWLKNTCALQSSVFFYMDLYLQNTASLSFKRSQCFAALYSINAGRCRYVNSCT